MNVRGQESRSQAGLRLCLLGRFELRSGDRVLLDRSWPRSRAKALLKVVALEGQIHRDRVMGLLWPDLDAQAGGANLRKSLHHLRSAVASGGVTSPVVSVRDEVLQLEPEVSVDLNEFRSLADAAFVSGHETDVDAALAAWTGDLLPEDLYEEWTIAARRELQALRRRLLVEGARLDEMAGLPDRAVGRLEAVLQVDPFDEEAHRRLMAAHARGGSRQRALRQFQDCARLLSSELGLEPSAETVALHDAILAASERYKAEGSSAGGRKQRPVLYGREAELEGAVDVVEGALAGAGATIIINGPAGIGKSRFAAEILAAASAAGARVASGRSFEPEAGVAYQPVRDALRHLAADDPAVDAALRHTIYAKRLLSGSPGTPAPVADPVLLESELVEEVVHVLTRLASERPIALLIEDLHAGDPSTLRLLHVLGRRLADCAGLLVATYRSEEVVAGSPADRLIVSLRRHAGATEVGLGPLPDAVVDLVVRERFGPAPVEPSLLRFVVAAAEGNPLFATELVDTLRKTRGARLDGGRWHGHDVAGQPTPAAVQDLVGQRLAGLDDDARHLVSLASVIGRSFDYEGLRRCVGAVEESMLDALDHAIEASILEEDEVGYRFRHELVRAAVHDRLTRARRQQLHRLVGDAAEAAGDGEVTGFHLARSDEPWRAVPHLRDDARRAGMVFANQAARVLFEQAVAIAREHHDRLPPASLAELLEDLGDLVTRMGHARTGAECLREALDRYGALGDEAAVLRVRAKAALGHMVVGDVDAATELLQVHLAAWEGVLLEEAGEEMAALAPSAALHMLADIRWHSGRHREALEAAERAVGLAESTRDVVERAQAYESMALACHSLGDWRRGLEYELQRGTLGLPGFTDVALDAHY